MNPRSHPEASGAEFATEEQATALKLWVVLARALSSVQAHLQANVAEHQLTLTEFAILEVLYHKGPLLLGEVQRRILVSSGGVTYLVDRLAAKGLVERRECAEDRRARYAALTAEGEALIGRIFPQHAACIERVLSGLTPAEQRTATDLLRRLGRTAAGMPSADPCTGT
jgi:MarR family transcriptional regulator, 2-MHQ and catechol-resistance regulon repressor